MALQSRNYENDFNFSGFFSLYFNNLICFLIVQKSFNKRFFPLKIQNKIAVNTATNPGNIGNRIALRITATAKRILSELPA